MEIKLTKVMVNRLKREYEMLYERKEHSASEIGKYEELGKYHGYGEDDALNYIKRSAQIEAVHNAFLVLGLNIWYDWETKEAHITDQDRNEVSGE